MRFHLAPDDMEPPLGMWAWVMGLGTGLPATEHILPWIYTILEMRNVTLVFLPAPSR
jgi:hypothetical protein